MATETSSIQIQRRLREPEVSRLVAAYRTGDSHRDLAAEFGIHRRTVAAHLLRAEVPVRPVAKLLDDQTVSEVATLYAGGQTLAQLADQLGVSSRVVRKALDSANVAIRPKGRRPGAQ